jgi:exonuclease III
MSNSACITDISSQDLKLDNNKKTVHLGTKQSTTKLTILQWNAGCLSSAKMTELKQITTQNDADLLIINEAKIIAENVQYYNIKHFTNHTLFKVRQIASGMLVTVRINLKSEFKIIKELNDYDTAEIVKKSIWKENKKFTIYGIYSPPRNKNLYLDTIDITSASVVIEDFNPF